jgi:hypothetical protein
MSAGTFQVPAPQPGQLAGRIEARIVDSGGNPPDIIKAGDPWGVEFVWELTGTLVPLIGGTWNLRLNIDQLGGPKDFNYPESSPVDVPVTPANGSYSKTINVPVGKLTADAGGSTYQVVASLAYTTPAGTPGPLAGYVNCGVIQVVA